MPSAAPAWHRARTWVAGFALAAAALLLARWHTPSRVGHVKAPLAQVTVQLYAEGGTRAALQPGALVHAHGALSASLHNTAIRDAFVLVVALDVEGRRLWIAPRLGAHKPEADAPSSGLTLLPSSDSERMLRQLGPKLEQLQTSALRVPAATQRPLGYSVPLQALAPGRVRVVTLISADSRLAAELDLLSPAQLTAAALRRRFPEGDVREFPLVLEP